MARERGNIAQLMRQNEDYSQAAYTDNQPYGNFESIQSSKHKTLVDSVDPMSTAASKLNF